MISRGYYTMRLNEDLIFNKLQIETGVKETMINKDELTINGKNTRISEEVLLLLKSQRELPFVDEMVNLVKNGKLLLIYKKTGSDVGICPFIPATDSVSKEKFVIVNIAGIVGKTYERFSNEEKYFEYDMNFKKLYGILISAFGVYITYDSNDFVSVSKCKEGILAVMAKMWLSVLNRKTGIASVEGNAAFFVAMLTKWNMARIYNVDEDNATEVAIRISKITDYSKFAAFASKYEYAKLAKMDLDDFISVVRGEIPALMKLSTNNIIELFAMMYTPYNTLSATYPPYVAALIVSRLSGYAVYDTDIFKRDFDKLIKGYEPAFVYEMEKRLKFMKAKM